MRREFSFAPIFLAAAAITHGQAPIPVTPCDLVNSPHDFDGRIVEVRARINLAFEDFTLARPGCEDKSLEVWLVFGGDVPTPTASTVNDLERALGAVLKVNGRPVKLVHDAALDLFRARLNLTRIGPIDTRPCYDCYLFHVTATLRGVFFGGDLNQYGMAGYGHLGCCTLLAIEQVKDVEAERTAIPMGGRFKCAEETRKLDASEAERIKAMNGDCTHLSYEQCLEFSRRQIAAAADFWSDSAPVSEGSLEVRLIDRNTDTQTWESPDKLKMYTLKIESPDPDDIRSQATGGSIARETCTAVVPPLAMTAVPVCRNLEMGARVTRTDARGIAQEVAAGKETWRLGTADRAAPEMMKPAAARWGLELPSDLALKPCGGPWEAEGNQMATCGWIDSAGMAAVDIQLTRFGYLRNGRGWDSVPWILTSAHGTACSAEH